MRIWWLVIKSSLLYHELQLLICYILSIFLLHHRLDYPGVGPEQSFLKYIGRADCWVWQCDRSGGTRRYVYFYLTILCSSIWSTWFPIHLANTDSTRFRVWTFNILISGNSMPSWPHGLCILLSSGTLENKLIAHSSIYVCFWLLLMLDCNFLSCNFEH
jgi:hypothetical protein